MVFLGRKIRLLMWKNLLLRRKHCWETLGMICFPIYFIVFHIFIVHHAFPSSSTVDHQSPSSTEHSAALEDGFEISDPYDINIGTSTSKIPNLVEFLTGERSATTKDIAYSPRSDKTSLVMYELATNLIKHNTKGNSKSTELRSFPSESTLEKYLQSWKDKPKDWKPFRVAVNFQDKLEMIEKADRTVRYKIRFVDEDLSTDVLHRVDGYRSDDSYRKWGFTALQVLTDKILIEKMTRGLINDIKLELQEFPRKVQKMPRREDFHPKSKSSVPSYVYYLQHCIIVGFLLCVPNIIRGVISEKQSGIKELMQILGLSNWMHWTGWMLDCLSILGISAILMTFFLFIPLSNPGIIQFCSVTLWFFVIILYIMAILSFCFFISVFFNQAFFATSIGCCCYLASYYGLVFTMDGSTLGEKMASSLLPNMAFHWAFEVILSFEERREGAGWLTIADPISETNQLSLLPVCGMLILDIIVYMTLTMYLERILPSEYGLRKPWYYIFQPSTWILKNEKPVKEEELAKEADAKVSDNRPGFEEDPVGLAVGIEICDLKKRFDSHKMAVDGISAKMHIGEITALLGHNGAGKTTTLSILTGLLRPTSGTAIINGYDITKSMEEIRKSLGLCPQQNMLFNELTVEQHLEFFGRLRGLTSQEAKGEASQIIWSLKMGEKADVESKKLSGGQKRRLCLANAVIGKASVLILDEPTSGLDPEARREVWDMLLRFRGGRTIVLTTHLMEEADVLGDRIVIMAEGKIQCSGTSPFLKKLYGNGYSIILTTKEGADAQTILSVVQKYIPQAFIDVSREQSSKSEFIITLPEEFTSSSVFPPLFENLVKKQQELGILTIGCKIATMDDVFVKVGELSHPAETEDNMEKYEDVSKTGANNCKGIYLLGLMFWGLMIKLFIRNMRNIKLIIFQVLPPIIAIILVCSITSSILRVSVPGYASRGISSKSYPHPISICKPMTSEAKIMCMSFALAIGGTRTTDILPVNEKPLVDFLMHKLQMNSEKFRSQYVIAAEMTKNGTEMKIKMMHSPYFYHSEPLAINAISNTVLKLLTNNSGKQIEVTNHPLNAVTARKVFDAAADLFMYYKYKSMYLIIALFGLLVPISLVLLTASSVIFPTEERLSNGKQLQRMAGVSPFLYWTCAFLWDFVLMSLIAIVMLICIYIFQPYQIFTDGYAAGALFLIFVVYYFSVIPLSYLMSTFCSTEDHGFIVLVKYHANTALLSAPITFMMDLFGTNFQFVAIAALMSRIIYSINPTFGFALSVIKFAILALRINKCNVLPDKEVLCNKHPEFFENSRIFSGCCQNVSCYKYDCNFKNNEDYCHVKEKYLAWELKDFLGFLTCYSEKLPGIGQELLAMFIVGIIYYILLFLVEYGILKDIIKVFKSSKSLASFAANSDDDVINEALRVHAQVSQEAPMDNNNQDVGIPVIGSEVPIGNNEVGGGLETENANQSTEKVETDAVAVEIVGAEEWEDALVVQNLCKEYKGFAAVSNISFGVKHGECFGLLGVNGAGKTTTFRMLTGDETPSLGNAIAEGYTLGNNKSDFLRQFGYCPQFDAIVPFMTGKEMLMFYGRLRGVPPKALKREVDMWIAKLGLTESANVISKKYSGGMKRRLGAGMALLGHPPIILLDDPTSGVDPISRRQFWKIISSAKEAGQAVILTSHSMDECEALCGRLGIMVNGQFQCFGGVQHLKNKFGEGHSLTIKLKTNAKESSAQILENTKIVTDLKDDLVSKFQKVIVKDQQFAMINQNVVQFQILDHPISLAAIFKVMEELKGRFEIIEEYSVGDTTLEQVFLSFARKQERDEEHAALTHSNSTKENLLAIFCPFAFVFSHRRHIK